MIKKLILFVCTLVILVSVFDVQIKENDYFEDGSGRITLTYCVPGELCE